MKNKIVLFLLLVSSLAFGQVPRVFTGKCNISQTGSGAGYWQVGVTNFDSPGGVYDAGDITVNDKLYFNDSGILYTLNITTIVSASGTNATIRVSNVGVTGISSVPTSAAEISRGTANYKFVPWTANMTDNDNQIVNEHSWYLADSLLAIQAAKGNITQGTLVAASGSRTVPMNGQDLTFDNADDIRLEATGEYFIGSGSGDLPTLDSDNNGFDLGLGSSNEMVLHQRAADQVLSKAGAPVNGTDIAWYVGQLLVNTVDGSVYRATAKSTNPDFSGTGSTWAMLPTGATSGVTTFESRTGTVTSAAGDYTASEVTNVPAGTISGITVQAAIDELATEKASVDSIPAHRTDINNLQVLTGRVDGSTNMGTYTGTTVPDNQSVKQNVQSLETAIEGVLPKDITTFGYNPLTRVVTLGKSDGGTITGAVTEVVFVTSAPSGTPAFPVAIDTVGTDTMYVANNGAWVRFASGGGTISQPAGQVVYGTGASVASSANLFWDATNSRLGIATSTPAEKVHVAGNTYVTGNYLSPVDGGVQVDGNWYIRPRVSGLTGGFSGSYGQAYRIADDANSNKYQWNLGTSEVMCLARTATGLASLGIGVATPSAKLHIKGTGATNATASLYAENSAGTPILKLSDDNVLNADPDVNGTGTMMAGYTNGFHLSGGAGQFYAPSQQVIINSGYPKGTTITAAVNNQTAANYSTLGIAQTFNPAAIGTNTFAGLEINPTINQTGGHSGTTRGLFINPTLTSAPNYRAIELSNGSIWFMTASTGLIYNSGDMVIARNASGSSGGGIRVAVNPASGGLSIAGNQSIFYGSAALHVRGSGTTSGTSALKVDDSAGDLKFLVRDDGNVGIGTSSPAVKLHVVGGFYVDNAGVGLTHRNATSNIRMFTNISSDNGEFYLRNSSDANKVLITSSGNSYLDGGNLGIGVTAPSEKLDVSGNVKFSGALMPNNLPGTSGQLLTSAGPGLPPTWTNAGGGGNLSGTGNAGSGGVQRLAFWKTATTLDDNALMVVDTANVRLGIGTSTPIAKLQLIAPTNTEDGTKVFSIDRPNAGLIAFITDQGKFQVGNGPSFYPSGGNGVISRSENGMFVGNSSSIAEPTPFAATLLGRPLALNWNPATGPAKIAELIANFNPVSGDATLTSLSIKPTINQTTGANGTIIGLDYNPTLTNLGGTHYAALFRSGRVGIGTATPDVELDVRGTLQIKRSTANYLMKFYDSTSDIWVGNFSHSSSSLGIGFSSGSNLGMSSLYTYSYKNFGVGTTTPTTNLEVKSATGADVSVSLNTTDVSGSGAAGGLRFANNGTNKWGIIYSANTYFGLYDYTASDYRMYVNNSGQIGFGNTNPSAKVEITSNLIGVGQTNTYGLALANNTSATLGNQQMSPPVRWRGNGWKTDATAGSQTVDFIADVLPVQGTAAPSGNWQLKSSINGATYNTVLSANSAGNLTVSSNSGVTATETLVTLNRPTAPTIGNETKLAFALAGTDVGVWSSKRESSSAYSMNFFTTTGGFLNSTPAIHLAQSNMVGINRDTASYGLDVKSGVRTMRLHSTTDNTIFRMTGNATGETESDGTILTNSDTDFLIQNLEDGGVSLVSNLGSFTVNSSGGFTVVPITGTQAVAIPAPAAVDGSIIYVSSTSGVFTSVGFWGRENGAWVKL